MKIEGASPEVPRSLAAYLAAADRMPAPRSGADATTEGGVLHGRVLPRVSGWRQDDDAHQQCKRHRARGRSSGSVHGNTDLFVVLGRAGNVEPGVLAPGPSEAEVYRTVMVRTLRVGSARFPLRIEIFKIGHPVMCASCRDGRSLPHDDRLDPVIMSLGLRRATLERQAAGRWSGVLMMQQRRYRILVTRTDGVAFPYRWELYASREDVDPLIVSKRGFKSRKAAFADIEGFLRRQSIDAFDRDEEL